MEKVMKRLTIEFGKSMSLEQTEDLLSYIAEELPADISYKPSQYKTLQGKGKGKIKKDLGTASISGTISPLEFKTMEFDAFESIYDEKDTSKIKGIKFIPIPGYDDLRDYGNKVTLWDNTREAVNKYFKN